MARDGRKAALMAAVGVVSFAVVILFVFVHLYRLGGEARLRTETGWRAIEQAHACVRTAVLAEAAGRGYEVAAEPDFLAAFENARDAMPGVLAGLRSLVGDDPAQLRLVDRIEQLARLKLDLIRERVDAARGGGLVRAREVAQDRRNAQLSQDLSRAVDVLVERRRDTLEKIAAATRLRERVALWAVVGLVAGIGGLGAIVVLGLRRDDARATALDDTIRQAQKLESLGHLTGGVAHDFNNALQVILTNLDLAARQAGGGGTGGVHLQNALMAAEQAGKITAQLLAFARRQPLRPQAVRVDALTGDLVALLGRILGAHIAIEFSSQATWGVALADPSLLQNALLNLAINARDAMPDGGVLAVEVADSTLDEAYVARNPDVSPGDYVRISVSDTGCGMSPEVLAHAFEPFYTTKAGEGGTGLGLSMVYGFVKQSNGHVSLYSAAGRGTTVHLYLPRTDSQPAPAVDTVRPARGNGAVVLVVEDDDGVRAGAVAQLADLGYRVVAARDGAAALSHLRGEGPIDALFTDMVLPGALDGAALAAEARRLRPGLPVLFTSGYAGIMMARQGGVAEDAALLSKPYRTRDLAEAMAGAVAAAAPSAAAAATGRAVLVVDDDALVRHALIETLRLWEYTVLDCASAEAALDLIAHQAEVGCLVADLELPGMSGLALCREARRLRAALPIILCSGRPIPPDAFDTIAGSAPEILGKPFRPARLRAALDARLKGD